METSYEHKNNSKRHKNGNKMNVTRKTVWDLGIEIGHRPNQIDTKRSLLFVGSKQSGKTSIIYRFLDKKDDLRPTLALDYLFTRTDKSDDNNQLCDIWELGEATNLLKLLPFVLKEERLKSMTIILVLDLSRPQELVSISECLLDAISMRVAPFIKKHSDDRRSSIKSNKSERRSSSSMIRKLIPDLTMPIIIMANKYDLFQDMESDDRRLISKYLCSLAQSQGCSLIYSSIKRDQLVNRIRLLLRKHAFDQHVELPEARFDYTKPIWMPVGGDPSNLIDGDSLEILKNMMIKRWKQIEIELRLPDDPANDENFKERDIDLIRSQRYEELERFRRQLTIKNS